MQHRHSVFHGTSLSAEDTPYVRPSHSVSAFNASFFSTSSDLAKDFATASLDSDTPLFPVLLEGVQQLKSPYVIRGDMNPFVEFGIRHGDPLEERQMLFALLREEYDGVVYHNQEDEPFEIVAFQEDSFIPKGFRTLIRDTWSKPMTFEQLERAFDRWKMRMKVERNTSLLLE